jgi:site-specific recombinase XerD
MRVDGQRLRAHIPKDIVKNGKALGPVQLDVEAEIVSVLTRYVEEARPVLLKGAQTDLLFVSSTKPTQVWNCTSARIKTITARYGDGHGIPEHSMRHLVARRYLRQHPGEYVGVAALLHDSLTTVLRVYAPGDPTRAVIRNAESLRVR